MGKAELLYYCPFTSLALDGDVEEETSSFKFFLLFTYKYLELFKSTCDFMFMIWGLQISSLTVKQQQRNSAKIFILFFFVVAFMENPLPCKTRDWGSIFFF